VVLFGATGAAASAAPGPLTKLGQAVAIASESRYQVVTLHDLAVSVGRLKGVPVGVTRSSAQRLGAAFLAEAAELGSLAPRAKSPTAELAASLRSYSGFATEVAKSSTQSFMPAGFSPALAVTDHEWLAALKGLGKADHANLLKEVPTLLYPAPPGPKGGRGGH
jgi:hypothetical protein